jgi:hypothetical protein
MYWYRLQIKWDYKKVTKTKLDISAYSHSGPQTKQKVSVYTLLPANRRVRYDPPPPTLLKDREYDSVLRDQDCRTFQRAVINEHTAMAKWRSVGEVEESTARNTCSTAHFTCNQLELNPGLRRENSTSNGTTHSRLVFDRFGPET